MNSTNFVNESRNVVFLSGYARGGSDNVLLLYQSANEERAIPIVIGPSMRRPRPNTPCEIKCHAFGYRDGEGKQWVRLEAIQIKRASVGNTPRRLVAHNALRPNAALNSKDFSPFESLEKIRAEIMDNLRLEEQVVNDLLADTSASGPKRGGFANRAILSGFVGHKAYVAPADDGSGDLGHVVVHLRQHTAAERAIPLRIQGADSRFGKLLKALHPISVDGEVRVAITKDADGNILTRNTYISTAKDKVGQGTNNDFARNAFPGWWADAVRDYYNEKREMQARAQQAQMQAHAAPVVVPSAGPAELPNGVQVTSDVF